VAISSPASSLATSLSSSLAPPLYRLAFAIDIQSQDLLRALTNLKLKLNLKICLEQGVVSGYLLASSTYALEIETQSQDLLPALTNLKLKLNLKTCFQHLQT